MKNQKAKSIYIVAFITVFFSVLSACVSTYTKEQSIVKSNNYNQDGVNLINQGRQIEAYEAFLKATELNPRNARAWYHLGLYFRINGDNKKAVKYYNRSLLVANSLSAKTLSSKCAALYDMGHKARALKACEKAADVDPNFAEAFYNRGVVLYSLNQKNEAFSAYKRTVSINKNHRNGWYNLSIIYQDFKQYDLAIDALKRALLIDPDFSSGWALLSTLYKGIEDYESALDAFIKFEETENP